MKRIEEPSRLIGNAVCWLVAGLFVLGLLVLAVRLKAVQIDESALYADRNDRQSVRRVKTPGIRGKIFDRNGELLAGNRTAVSIVCNAEYFQRKSWKETEKAILESIVDAAKIIGVKTAPSEKTIRRYVQCSRTIPLTIWRDVDEVTLARFMEHSMELPGFSCVESQERFYPHGSLAAHLIGYVGRETAEGMAGDRKFNYSLPELCGRSGIEVFYDSFLRGVPGENRLRVDARCFATGEWVVQAPKSGPNLQLALDWRLQRVAEEQLQGFRGACVMIDPRNGEVLVFASSPAFDLNTFVPRLDAKIYEKHVKDSAKPLLNRASGGTYAPGSTFKPVTALAGLVHGVSDSETYCCSGYFEYGDLLLHCARRWGHGDLDMRSAIKDSCNPYFCNLGITVGTNELVQIARTMGLGAKTGIDLGIDSAGVVPDGEWKMRTYHEKWYHGDLAQMSIGQGMLLVSPLQMARVVGAIATGYLVTPRVKLGMPVERKALPFSPAQLQVVRDGMRMVITDGSGKKGAEGVPVQVSGKTGTAEVGLGENRRKNTWFVAYAPSEAPEVAIAMVVENGDSGGGTTAPKVAAVLRAMFADREASK